MDQIEKDVIAAKELNLSYGYYKALSYNPAPGPTPTISRKRNHWQRSRKFTDMEAFALWQQYMTDSEIAEAVGVSRAYIQRWRDQLELPSTSRECIDTKKYRLTTMRDGTSVVLIENDFPETHR